MDMVATSAHTADGGPTAWRRIGRYELGPRLAAGGMAELYVARATGVHGFRKYVAIKRILPQWAGDHEFVEMFLDEARLAAQLDHPNVVHVHDIGEDEDGPFFTMDYIHGQSLLAIARRLRAQGSSLPWDAFVALGSAAAAGLHHAHERRGFDGEPLGIIHRDVSPTNILVTYDGVVKLVDFGIAKASTSRHSTRPSTRKGKMAYMSPEQCKGETLDRKSDVFALGVVLYELCTLTRAFHGEGEFAVMNAIVNHDLPPPSSRRHEVPREIDAILLRAVARDPSARYDSARQLQHALDELALDMGLGATPAALAAVMDALFGATPYPWQGAALQPSDTDPQPDAATEASVPTTAKPVLAASTDVTRAEPTRAAGTPATRRPPRRRLWALGGLAAGAIATAAWIAAPRGDAASPPATHAGPRPEDPDPARDPAQPGAAVTDEATPAGTSPAERTLPTTPPSPATAPTSPAAALPPPATEVSAPPAPPTPAPRPERRTSKRLRGPAATSSASSPTLPAPFDPDAPAPRVR